MTSGEDSPPISDKSKPVYIAFGGHGRSYLAHFHRFLSDHHLTRKLRLDRVKKSNSQDPYSYLGTHPAWGDAKKALQIKNTMQFVTHEIEAIRDEKVTGKRRKN
jgi:hypothetical protein